MKESAFRSRLISEFRTSHPKGFIWAMDAKFKAGFPDLYMIVNSVPGHAELKVCKKLPKKIESLFSKIQLHTIGQITKAGVQVFGIVGLVDKVGKLSHVIIRSFNDGYGFDTHRTAEEFFKEWRELEFERY